MSDGRTAASIRSPIDGIILKRNVDPGQTVASTLQAAAEREAARADRLGRLPVTTR